MEREELIAWLIRHNYSPDRFGHYQKTVDTINGKKTYRYKLSTIAARREVKGDYGWVRLSSNYLKKLSINEKDQLCGLSFLGCQVKDSKPQQTE